MTTSDDDDMLPEYDFSKGVRNNQQRAEIMRTQGYSVTVHHEDGTSTTRFVHPSHPVSTDTMSTDKQQHLHGDFVRGDKVMGDKVGGDKVMGDKITHHHSQNLAQAAQEIKALLEQLDKDYDNTTPVGQAMISAKAVETIANNPTFKARVVNALKEGGTTALEELVQHPAVKPLVALLKGFVDA